MLVKVHQSHLQLGKKMTNEQRIETIIFKSKENILFTVITPKRALENGQVFVELNENISASKRGMLLLDFEEYLKNNIDQGINVWCESLGDKNSLRNLRGIQLKS